MRLSYTIYILILAFVLFVNCQKEERENGDLDKLKTHLTNFDSLFLYTSGIGSTVVNSYKLDSIRQYLDVIPKGSVKKFPDSLKFKYYYYQAVYYNKNEQKDSALEFIMKGREYLKQHPNRKEKLDFKLLLYKLYYAKDDYINGLATLQDVYKTRDKRDSLFNFHVLRKFTEIFNMLEEVDSMTKYLNMAYNYPMQKSYNQKAELNINYFNLLMSYPDSMNKAFTINERNVTNIDSININLQLNSLYNRGYYFDKVENFDEVINTFRDFIDLVKTYDDQNIDHFLSQGYTALAGAETDNKNYKRALQYIDSVTLLSKEVSGDQKIELERTKLICYSRLQEIDKIDQQVDEMLDANDSIFKTRLNTEILSLKEANQKQEELKTQNLLIKNNRLTTQRNAIIISLILLFVIALIFYFYQREKIQKQDQIIQGKLLRQRLLRSQMNPHFIFNSIANIHSKLELVAPLYADYLLKFSRLLRLSFKNSTSDFISLSDEIELLKNYMDLQLFRFEDNFEYSIHTNNLDLEDVKVPPMLIQPFIENCIQHGFNSIDYKGKIEINFNLDPEKDLILCCITDNGKGMEENSYTDKKESSIYQIKDFIKEHTKRDIRVKSDKKNTRVSFYIPYK